MYDLFFERATQKDGMEVGDNWKTRMKSKGEISGNKVAIHVMFCAQAQTFLIKYTE